MNENNSGSPTFKYLVGVLLLIVFASIGVITADTRSSIIETRQLILSNTFLCQDKVEDLQKEKLDKEQYHRDIADIRDGIKSINAKIDRMRK
jgi:hypothetical protein